MELKEAIAMMRSKINGFDAFIVRAISTVTDDVVKVMKERIRSGENSKGGSFSGYSSQWSSVRARKGLGSTKNFDFTGSMINFFDKEKVERKSKSEVTVWLDTKNFSRDDDGRKKKRNRDNKLIAKGHSEREGLDIFGVSEEEEEKANELLTLKIREYFNVT